MLTNKVNGKSYIGQTIRPIEKRLEEHETGRSSGCRAIYNAIQKYGWENFGKDWYYCPDEDLNKHEELMIEVLGTLSPYGYNLKEGGGNGKLSEETKQKMGESHRGEKSYMFGIPKSEEIRQKMSEAKQGEKSVWYGKTHTAETIQKMSEANRGENNPMWGKTGEKHYRSKRVYQYALDGTFINSFETCGEAARHLIKKDGSSISACALGNRKTAYGFKWMHIKIN